MDVEAIKKELHKLVDGADSKQIKEIYGLTLDYFNGQYEPQERESLSPYYKKRLEQSLKEADAGLGRPADEITREIREKYGLK